MQVKKGVIGVLFISSVVEPSNGWLVLTSVKLLSAVTIFPVSCFNEQRQAWVRQNYITQNPYGVKCG
jgi:hypothetical protein